MPLEHFELRINNTMVSEYLDNYSVEIQDIYDTDNSFTAMDGTQKKLFIGSKRILQVNFCPMSQEQIQELFTAIRDLGINGYEQEITYIDPELGEITKTFVCNNLPSATYFEADVYTTQQRQTITTDKKLYWTIPTITFEEIEIDSSGGVGGYEYMLTIGDNVYTNDKISKDLSINMSVSSNGFSIGELASCGISGAVWETGANITFQKNVRIILSVNINNGGWNIVSYWFLQSYSLCNNILSFSGLDCMALLDNNYYMSYQRDSAGEIIPKKVNEHLNAISTQLGSLIQQQGVSIAANCDNLNVSPKNNSNIRSFLQDVATSSGYNLKQSFSGNTISIDHFEYGGTTKTITTSECSNIKYGYTADNIDTIILYCGSVSSLPTDGNTSYYQYYNIYVLGTQPSTFGALEMAKTLELKTPYAPLNAIGGGSRFTYALNKSFGTEFQIEQILLNEFIFVGTEIVFTDTEDFDDLTFYATSINYKLSKYGFVASISGGTKSAITNKFLGEKEREIDKKIEFNATYNNAMINSDGLFLAAPKA